MAKHQFKKGEPRPKAAGRVKGTPNKITRDTKEVIADLLKLTAPIYAEKMIEKAQSKNPEQVTEFMTRFEKLIEFDVPKLQRSEIQAEVKTEITDTILKAFEGVKDETIQPES